MSTTASHPSSTDERAALLDRLGLLLPLLVLAVFIGVSALFRPVLSPDETRYLTVAWEMFRSHDLVIPTVNGALYDQKPPLLFWLIDAVWQVSGPNRAGALAAVFAISASVVLLTRRLAKEAFPDEDALHRRVGWAMVGNAVFALYAGLVLFDLLLTLCILIALCALLANARRPNPRRLVTAGVGFGLSLLAKGPVGLLFLAPVVLSYPLWRDERHRLSTGRFLLSALAALALGVLLTGFWLVPAWLQSEGAYLKGLIVDQVTGRVSGSASASHGRPFWFFLPLLPIFGLPWLLSPVVWRRHAASLRRPVAAFRRTWRQRAGLRMAVVAILVPIVCFSAIAGKQPHYLVPLLPFVSILWALAMRDIAIRLIATGATIMLAVLVTAQAIGQATILPRYDIEPLARVISRWDGPVAFAGTYQGEFGFLAELTEPVQIVELWQGSDWLARHPGGLLLSTEWKIGEDVPGRLVLDRRYEVDQRMTASVE